MYDGASTNLTQSKARAMAARMKTAPHASLSCQCVACQRAPIRREAKSKVVRPIAKGCAITRMAERAMCFHYKKRMKKALAPIQTGVAVAGGAAMGVYMLECMMRLDPAKAQLNVDIQNMFNTLCRVSLLNDVIDSEEITRRIQ